MKKVSHPNCVLLHEVYDEPNKTYLVLDLCDPSLFAQPALHVPADERAACEAVLCTCVLIYLLCRITGGTVMDRIIAIDHFSEKDAAAVTADVLNAIYYLHNIGITHRDLKPENLLYASNDPNSPDYNTIKVADFGLAKFVSEASMMKTTCGTPGYVAPEVLDPYLPFTNGYGPEVDLWSFGVVLYIMLCGFPPFYDDSTAVLFKQIRKGEYTFPSPYWDDVSEGAKDIVSKVLVVDPSKRLTAQQCLEHPWIANAGDASAKKLHPAQPCFPSHPQAADLRQHRPGVPAGGHAETEGPEVWPGTERDSCGRGWRVDVLHQCRTRGGARQRPACRPVDDGRLLRGDRADGVEAAHGRCRVARLSLAPRAALGHGGRHGALRVPAVRLRGNHGKSTRF